jgi:hypothetical protein
MLVQLLHVPITHTCSMRRVLMLAYIAMFTQYKPNNSECMFHTQRRRRRYLKRQSYANNYVYTVYTQARTPTHPHVRDKEIRICIWICNMV